MMNRFYEDDFVFLEEDLENSFIHYCYKEPTPNGTFITDSDYQRAMTVYGNRVKEHQHKILLVNTLHSQYPIPPAMQEWTAQEIAPLTTCLRRMAFVLSPDLFSQVSLQQMMEEDGIIDIYSKPHYFDNEADARAWLFA